MFNYDEFIDGLRSDKARVEVRNAVLWLNQNEEIARQCVSGLIGHPALLFSGVIEALIADFIRGNDGALTILVRWICRDEKAPFGMILKIKALKAMIRNSTRLSQAQWGAFEELVQRVSGKQYRPREYLYLDKLLAKHKH